MQPLKHLNNIPVYKGGKPIDELKRELNVDKIIKLASNENPFGCSLFVKKKIEAEALNINRYPDQNAYYLREELSKFLGISENQLIFGNGSNDVLDLIARVYLDDKSEVIIFEGSFLVYKIVSLIQGASIKEVPLENNFQRDLNKILDAITEKTKIIFIDNPCNPTGVMISKSQFDEFVEKLPENVLLVIDEAYFEYAKDFDFPESLSYLSKKNIIITRTFSKAYGLAGLRIGYGISNEEIIQNLEKVRQPFNVNHLAQVGAIEALKDQQFISYCVKQNEIGKQYIYNQFEKLGIKYIKSFANFVMFKSPVDNLYEKLLSKGVSIRPAFEIKDYYRVSIGTLEENEEFIKSLKSLI